MARLGLSFATLALCLIQVYALPYLDEYADWNLNTKQGETDPTKYWGQWEDHDFQPSPDNWRFPFYTLFLDRFVNGDPSNDNINGTLFEVDITSNQLRYGGDIEGLIDTLDYIQGMGIKGIYIAGSPFMNLPWAADSYSPTDLTLLDWHFGNITIWRNAISEIHERGMYVILDNTIATMSDLIGFEGYLNGTAPFKWDEHNAVYKTGRRYWDFDVSNDQNDDCNVPKFWNKDATMVGSNVTDNFKTCKKSEFDLFGDVESFGTYPEYQKQLSKFSFVQDRLKEWDPTVLKKLKLYSCIAINMLDFDGFRIDKQLTITLEAQAEWSQSIRECAAKVGKKNFLISGEIVSDNTLGSIYIGRGKEPQMKWATNEESYTANLTWPEAPAIYQRNTSAVDAWAFHYTVYRSLLRFLGIDGIYEAERDLPIDWVDAWNEMVKTNDMINANTGKFDPRHLYGATNQDVFRWPGITNGTDRNLAGLFVTTMIMPGIPLLFFGEEQAYYVLESTADNYIFGRQPLSSSLAWQDHGCYSIPFTKYTNFPLNTSLTGCKDDTVSYDHRDPSHPVRNIIKRMYELRAAFPTLNDGFELQKLSNMTYWNYLPGSKGTGTEMGLRSVVRMRHEATQDLSGSGAGNLPVWLVYSNDNTTTTYTFDCSDNNRSLIAPYDSGTTVKNLFYPYEEYTLKSSPLKLGLEDQTGSNGCLDELEMKQWGFKAFVPVDDFVDPNPVITKFVPGHDSRIKATKEKESVDIEIHFSHEMSCDSLTKAISFTSDSADGSSPTISNAQCTTMSNTTEHDYNGAIPSAWKYAATLTDVAHGVHRITITNATTTAGLKTGTKDHFMIRVGDEKNPITFPRTAKFSSTLVGGSSDNLIVSHNAAGATKFRASRDWGSTWTEWLEYTGENYTMPALKWTGTNDQKWDGEHVIVQYWGRLVSSSAHQQEGDLNSETTRAFPHIFVNGPYNQYGYDGGLHNTATLNTTGGGGYHFDLATEWPAKIQFNIWGMNPDGKPDQSFIYGDIDGDGVLDRLPPSSLTSNTVNISSLPSSPYTAYRLAVSYDGKSLTLQPTGHMGYQLTLFILLWVIPVLTAAAVIWLYMKSFYQVKFNTNGVAQAAKASIPLALRRRMKRKAEYEKAAMESTPNLQVTTAPGSPGDVSALAAAAGHGKRRAVLIATMEYDIEDWNIKIKIGGLGVMAQLMGKSLGHQDLIWVVPCVGGVDYPVDEVAEPMFITIMDKVYQINVGIHKLRNITYVLLDAPVFRQQTKSEPYPPRMDDLDSGIYYSAWNQCIAETVKRFPQIDLYHINDYHGALAPLYLLPNLIPCALSLHNAEFQGLWPMRTHAQVKEVCSVFNLDEEIAKRYVQFGEVFNLLHAAASYLRIHQKGFGAVGVSRKYGKRSFARYPIFWGLPNIGSLPNPDPTDTGEWDRNEKIDGDVPVDPAYEASRGELKRQAQEWAGLNQDPEAELFVFVGRWSMQKGVDLIADVFPSVLKNYPKVQLIAIGPVIDLYGRFAAIKLQKIMELFPGRVYSKPEFTALPPFIFSGAEFALIPSRDEPFGLVAVEFGRKGALGVGARVGGLGQMPGWWFTVESMTPKHLIRQFKSAIHDALASDTATRAQMRARSAKQRFPVAQWVEDLETLQSTCIKINHENAGKHRGLGLSSPSMLSLFGKSPKLSPNASQVSFGMGTPTGSRPVSAAHLSVPPHSPGQASPRPDDIYSPALNSPASSPGQNDVLLPPPPLLGANLVGGGYDRGSVASFNTTFSNSSVLSLDTVVGSRHDMALQKVDPSFTDANGYFSREFEQKLEKLNPSTSENQLCIEDILIKSEKKWHNTYRDAKLGKTLDDSSMLSLGLPNTRPSSPAPSALRSASGRDSPFGGRDTMTEMDDASGSYSSYDDMHPLGNGYDTPTGIKKFMMIKLGDWPIYSLFLALGQTIAANSYQVSLLSGEIGQSATTLYIIATIFAVSSLVWWYLFRRIKSYYVLSLPFVLYGAAFFCVGVAPFATSTIGKTWAQRVGSGLYSVASASGSIYFAQNFGDEGGAPIKTWILRACLVQGTQQIYISALWYWGSALTQLSDSGVETRTSTPTAVIAGVCLPLAVILWAIAAIVYLGLPNYYRQIPGDVPDFYRSLYRRKIIMWFFITVFVQNYWLAAPYGRNWRFLWTTNHASAWQIAILVIFFFIILWAAAFWYLGRLSKSHSWILPMFAIGVGAPRWAQMLWGVSGIANYMPWIGNQTASALVARALWLWLGVLDALQGVGFGMMLLQTMTRFHNTFSLIAAQFIGSVATILGRATAPDRLGPGPVFPNFAVVGASGLANASFWICLLMQLGICVGFATFFRKEQLMKP
ncbi:Alpha-glucan synthase [Lasiodiplodia theobromae]|uniref:Alpha-glucan synthase n=1 Tax=Lasiodiplodia theobromae TaxID=45133 RepID=UPI0015C2DEAE|nr:Alpha-glucan synthase [Lasiodiplodia theobromae]KAF4539253.1 Alpha-glucan synthase [Lasiodiplodia theobromae]